MKPQTKLKIQSVLKELKELKEPFQSYNKMPFNERSGPSFVRCKFCPECDNLLYPKENKTDRKLMWACRICFLEMEADHPYVHVDVVEGEFNRLQKISTDCLSDPTLPRAKILCTKCGHNEAVYFESESKKLSNLMKLYYVCSNVLCKNKWSI